MYIGEKTAGAIIGVLAVSAQALFGKQQGFDKAAERKEPWGWGLSSVRAPTTNRPCECHQQWCARQSRTSPRGKIESPGLDCILSLHGSRGSSARHTTSANFLRTDIVNLAAARLHVFGASSRETCNLLMQIGACGYRWQLATCAIGASLRSAAILHSTSRRSSIRLATRATLREG